MATQRSLTTTPRARRALVVCPGRGSYNAAELNSLRRLPHKAEWKALVDTADELCTRAGLTSITELDSAQRFSRGTHLEAAHASALIYTLACAEYVALQQDADWEPVAMVGNSLGWYMALHLAGAVSFKAGLDIVLSTGGFQRCGGLVGGQLVYPVFNEEWHEDDALTGAVAGALETANRCGVSHTGLV